MIVDARRLRGLRRARGLAFVGAMILWIAALVGAILDLDAFLRAYLLGWLGALGLGLGGLVLLCVHHLVDGRWGRMIRPTLEAMARTIPLLALAGAPLLLGLDAIYAWTDPLYMLAEPLRAAKAGYLTPTLFFARSAAALGSWALLARWVARAPRGTARPGPAALTLVIFFITITSAAVDWILSVEPTMSSSAFGLEIATSDAVAGIAAALLIAATAHRRLGEPLPTERFHELGNLGLCALMLWAYVAFTQYLLVWAADLPRQSYWYLERFAGGWEAVSWSLVTFRFALPFLALLFRAVKRRPAPSAAVAALLLATGPIELAWLLLPARAQVPGAAILHWLDPVLVLAFGALWLALFLTHALAVPGGRLLSAASIEGAVP